MEKKGILGETVGRRPGDVTFERWTESKGLAIDVRTTKPCEWYAVNRKHRKYDTSFNDTNYVFSAVIFESLDIVNSEGEEILKQLFRFALRLTARACAPIPATVCYKNIIRAQI